LFGAFEIKLKIVKIGIFKYANVNIIDKAEMCSRRVV